MESKTNCTRDDFFRGNHPRIAGQTADGKVEVIDLPEGREGFNILWGSPSRPAWEEIFDDREYKPAYQLACRTDLETGGSCSFVSLPRRVPGTDPDKREPGEAGTLGPCFVSGRDRALRVFSVCRHTAMPSDLTGAPKSDSWLMFPAMCDLGYGPYMGKHQLEHFDAILHVWGTSAPISVSEPNERDIAFCKVVPATKVGARTHPAIIQPIIAAFRVKTTQAAFRLVKDSQWKTAPAWDPCTWVSLIQKVHDDSKLDDDLLRAENLLSRFKIDWPGGVQEIRGLQRGEKFNPKLDGLPNNYFVEVLCRDENEVVIRIRLRVGHVAGLISFGRVEKEPTRLVIVGRTSNCSVGELEMAGVEVSGMRYDRMKEPVSFKNLLAVSRKDGKPCAHPGDSGGPVYVRAEDGALRLAGTVLGQVHAGTKAEPRELTLVQPITQEYLNELGLELLTYPESSK